MGLKILHVVPIPASSTALFFQNNFHPIPCRFLSRIQRYKNTYTDLYRYIEGFIHWFEVFRDFNGKREDGVWNPFDDCSSILWCCARTGSELGYNFHAPTSSIHRSATVERQWYQESEAIYANIDTMRALALNNLEVMVAIPNEMLEVLTLDSQAADDWVARNVTRYTFPGGVNIK